MKHDENVARKKRKRDLAQTLEENGLRPQMPSTPKKTTTTTTTTTKKKLSPEDQALVVKQRKEAIEKRMLRLQAKIDKDRALLQKYAVVEMVQEESSEGGEGQAPAVVAVMGL
jgi:hypothetical protein